MTDRVAPPPGYRAPDIYSLILRSWIEALDLKLLAYRRKDFTRG